jgi:hypothetical protein
MHIEQLLQPWQSPQVNEPQPPADQLLQSSQSCLSHLLQTGRQDSRICAPMDSAGLHHPHTHGGALRSGANLAKRQTNHGTRRIAIASMARQARDLVNKGGLNRHRARASSIGILGRFTPAYRRARIVLLFQSRPSHSLSNLPSAYPTPSPRSISHPTGPLAQRAPPTRAPTRPPNGHIQRTPQRP